MRVLPAFFWMLWAVPALAAEAGTGDGLLVSWVKLIVALLVVLGLILLIYAASRKGFGFLPAARGGLIKVVEMRSLGPKKVVCLVRVRDEEFLLGLGGERVELIARLGVPGASFAETLENQREETP